MRNLKKRVFLWTGDSNRTVNAHLRGSSQKLRQLFPKRYIMDNLMWIAARCIAIAPWAG
jgi:hypothetical protein